MSLRLLFVLVLIVAGCGSSPEPDATAAPVPPPVAPPPRPLVTADPADAATTRPADAIALDGEGLRFVSATGSTSLLAFGTPAGDAVDAVARLRGEPAERSTNAECPPGPLDAIRWDDGLTLYAREGQFAGWAVRGEPPSRTLATMTGVGIGSARADLEAGHVADARETTLGTEFTAGGLSGLLTGPDADATVTALWAGTSCVFR